MSSAKKVVQYDEGEASVVLTDGTVAERGKPVEVDAEMADRLVEQGWTEVRNGKPVDPPPPHPTEAAIELADELGINPAAVTGTGGANKNQVTVEDVEKYAEDRDKDTASEAAGSTKE